jgi:hypothetical protein
MVIVGGQFPSVKESRLQGGLVLLTAKVYVVSFI